MRSNLVSVKCKIELGAFSGERVFVVRLANGDEYRSLASISHCMKEKGKALATNEPISEYDMDGFVKAIKIKKELTNIIVEVPDGQLIMVSNETIK